MFDRDTLIVSYDAARGEPRGSRKRAVEAAALGLGDCVDCQLCVQVCPTGIDIRNGLQYQCIGCAHCVDACDAVMKKVGSAPGLIRYTTEHAIAGARSRILRPRVVGYASALLGMIALFGVALVERDLFGIEILRERGALYQQVGDQIRNDYALKVINKTQQTQRLQLSVAGPAGVAVTLAQPQTITIDSGDVLNLPIELLVERSQLIAPIIAVTFRVCNDADDCVAQTSHFFGPGAQGAR